VLTQIPDVAIGGCSAAISSGEEAGDSLAKTFNNRGNAYDYKKQYDRAIEDFNEAIRLKPDFAIAYNNRGRSLSLRRRDPAIISQLAYQRHPKFPSWKLNIIKLRASYKVSQRLFGGDTCTYDQIDPIDH
jgi:tetratricopeptide (TPR) repeat protein